MELVAGDEGDFFPEGRGEETGSVQVFRQSQEKKHAAFRPGPGKSFGQVFIQGSKHGVPACPIFDESHLTQFQGDPLIERGGMQVRGLLGFNEFIDDLRRADGEPHPQTGHEDFGERADMNHAAGGGWIEIGAIRFQFQEGGNRRSAVAKLAVGIVLDQKDAFLSAVIQKAAPPIKGERSALWILKVGNGVRQLRILRLDAIDHGDIHSVVIARYRNEFDFNRTPGSEESEICGIFHQHGRFHRGKHGPISPTPAGRR